MVFSHRRISDIPLSLNNQPVKIDNKAKFLGLVYDSKLNWREHITYLEEKCKKRLQLMRAVAGNTVTLEEQIKKSYSLFIGV